MKRRRWPEETGIVIILALVVVAMAVSSENFRTVANLRILLLNGAVIAFLAMGQCFVLLTGGIDLSAGANIAMTGVLAAVLMRAGLPWELAALVSIVAGTSLGLLNGFFIHYVGLPAFIVTFCTFGMATSIPQIITGANSVSIKDPAFAVVGRGVVMGVPMPVVLVLVAAIILTIVLRYAPLGVQIYATGGNAEASRLAGVNIGRIILVVYAVSGFCASIGGMIVASRLMVGYTTAGSGQELFFSIASAVVGGVSLFGGVGSIIGALLGAILIATVSNGMNVLGVESYWQSLVIGVIILAGVTLDTYRRRISFGAQRRKRSQQSATSLPAAPVGGQSQ